MRGLSVNLLSGRVGNLVGPINPTMGFRNLEVVGALEEGCEVEFEKLSG